MTPAAIIREAAADGVSLALSSAGTIKAVGDQAAVNRWLPILREHKPGVMAALAGPAVEPDPATLLWWRVSITEPRGRTVEIDTPSGCTLPEWRAYAERYHGPGCAVTPSPGSPSLGTGQPR
jgi:hypothetical protein